MRITRTLQSWQPALSLFGCGFTMLMRRVSATAGACSQSPVYSFCVVYAVLTGLDAHQQGMCTQRVSCSPSLLMRAYGCLCRYEFEDKKEYLTALHARQRTQQAATHFTTDVSKVRLLAIQLFEPEPNPEARPYCAN